MARTREKRVSVIVITPGGKKLTCSEFIDVLTVVRTESKIDSFLDANKNKAHSA